jgi:hypothetical protein
LKKSFDAFFAFFSVRTFRLVLSAPESSSDVCAVTTHRAGGTTGYRNPERKETKPCSALLVEFGMSRELDEELQHFLDRRRRRPGNCQFCGKPNTEHRTSIKDPANGCALAELLFEIAEVQAEHSRKNGGSSAQ